MYASDENYKYKKKLKVISRTVHKNKRNETRRQKVKHINSNNHNNPYEPVRVVRKKMAITEIE
jgi:hypothetical protein